MTAPLSRAMPILIALLTTIGPLGIDMYLPAIPIMAETFQTSEGAVQLSLMTFFAGLMLGQLFYGPLSDKFGRKPLIFLGLGIFILGAIGCSQAQNIEVLHVWRFIQGLGGSIGMVIAFAIIKDCYHGAEMGKMMSMVLALLGLAPVIAPIVGNGLAHAFSWRAIFLFLAIYAALVLLACIKFLPETRLQPLRDQFHLGETFKHYWNITKNRNFIVYAISLCIAQAGFFAYIAGSASVFISQFNLSATQFSFIFAINALGLIAAAIINPKLHEKIGLLNTYKLINTLFFADLSILLLCIHFNMLSLAVFCLTMFIAVTLLGFLMPTGSQLALMKQHQLAGTASALLGSMQFGFGAFVSAITGSFANYGALGLASIMFACAFFSMLICYMLFPKKL